jgi:hypothetical protein
VEQRVEFSRRPLFLIHLEGYEVRCVESAGFRGTSSPGCCIK